MPIEINGPSGVSQSGGQKHNYYSRHGADQLVSYLCTWRDAGYPTQLINANTMGVIVSTLRQKLYEARRYIKEHPEVYDQPTRMLAESTAFKTQGEDGMVIVRRSDFTIAAQVSSIRREDNFDARNLYWQWVSGERALGERYVIPGPLSAEDIEFFRARQIADRGQFLFDIHERHVILRAM